MTKQLITLIGALVSAAVIVAAVLIGVVPLVGGVFSADGQRQQVATTNAAYETQIAALAKQQQRLGEIQDAVAQLRSKVPESPLRNEVFERISRSETAAGVRVVSVTTADPVPYVARTGTGEPAPAPAAPTSTDTAAGATPAPIDAAESVADQASANAGAQNGAAAPTGGTAPTASPGASARSQVELSIRITAPDMDAAFAFLDGLRTGPRAIAIDSATAASTTEGIELQITALAFIHAQGGE